MKDMRLVNCLCLIYDRPIRFPLCQLGSLVLLLLDSNIVSTFYAIKLTTMTSPSFTQPIRIQVNVRPHFKEPRISLLLKTVTAAVLQMLID